MTPLVLRHPVDPTGASPNNRVQNEARSLVDRPRRAIVPTYGAFFTQSLIIHDAQRLFELKRGVHYDVMGLFADATKEFGKEVACIIVIKSAAVSSEVVFTYQAVGGAKYQSVMHIAVEVTKNLTDDDRELVWTALSNRPSMFYPAHHFHDIGDAYAFDPLVNTLEGIRGVVLASDRAAQDDLYLNVDGRIRQLSRQTEKQGAALIAAHEADPDAHPQYAKAADVTGQRPMIRRPINAAPLVNATNQPILPILTAGKYYSAYRAPQRLVQFQISRTADFAVVVDDSGPLKPTATYTCRTTLLFNTDYYWRHRFNDEDNYSSDWSVPTRFRTRGN